MSNLEEFLKLEVQGSRLVGRSPYPSPEKPTASGPNWVTAPTKSAGLAYRFQSGSIDRLSVQGDSVSVSASCTIDSDAANIATSFDGRLVVVACIDGSLRCFDSTDSSLTHRWTLPNAHSHITPELATSPSSDRTEAAAASGPVHSLEFAPKDYELLLVDHKKGLCIFNAAMSAPNNLITPKKVASAAWGPSQFESTIAVGNTDGTIEIFKFLGTKLEPLSNLGCPNSDEDGFSCTHLDWKSSRLIAGLCRVIPSDEEPDEDDDDDTAEHEAILYSTTIDVSTCKNSEWSDHGDVVPFFSVPKNGRHVYFTSFLESSQNLIVVASNVGSDIAVLAEDSGEWQLLELQEGYAATTPTTEDDEFCYPAGLVVIPVQPNSFRMLLAATDGSISAFSFENETEPQCFTPQTMLPLSELPANAVAVVDFSSPPDLTNEPDVAEELENVSSKSTNTPGFSFGSTGTTPISSFGVPGNTSPSTKNTSPSLFGSGNSVFGSGLGTFGTGIASTPKFGEGVSYSFGSPGGTSFGTTSPLGASIATPEKQSKGPTFGSPSGFVFGAGTSASGGFGALSSSGNASTSFGNSENSGMNTTVSATKEAGDSDAINNSAEGKEAPDPSQKYVSKIPAFGSGSFGSSNSTFGASTTFGTSTFGTSTFGASTGAFGSGIASAPKFGQGVSYSFGSPGGTSFGITSPLGASIATPEKQPKGPTFGSPSGSVFGAGTSASGGFGALSSSGKVSTTFGSSSGGFGLSGPSSTTSEVTSLFSPNKENPRLNTKISEAKADEESDASENSTESEDTPEPPQKHEPQIPTFGSGSKVPTFSFSSSAPVLGFGAGTTNSTLSSASPFGAFGSSSTSPFGAFGSPQTTSSGAHSMAKPLFSTKPAVPSSADKNEAKQPDPTPAKEAIPSKPVSATPSTAAGKRAATVFDQVDLSKKGVLPVSAFEDLLEEIGSGFHGEEYDAQIAILDPSESGNITRSAFIDWYTDFVEGNDRDDDGSLDSDERAERAEEEEKAKKAFKKFSKVVGGVSTIPASDFGEMMESMGTTYCEEEHRSTLKKLTKPGGVIKEADFLSWYIDWLFGDGSDDEDDEDDSEGEGDAGGASEEKTSLSSIFKVDKDSWRCDVCSVPNPSDKKKCAACETPRPGAEDDDEGDKSKPTSSLGSIGTGGFTFGSSAGGSIGSGGFSFGASSGAGASKTPESSSGGFTFGGSSASSTTAKPVASSGGFTFGGSSASSTTTKPVTSSGGFTFGGSSTSSTTEKPVTSSGGFSFGTSSGSTASSASPFGAFGSSSTSPFGAFGSPPTTSSGAHSMAKPLFSTKPAVPSSADKNEAKQPDPTPAKEAIPSKPVSATPSTAAGKRAATVFDQVDLSKKGVLPVSAFEDLLEEIGSGFHGEEYDAQIAILDPSESGNITRSAFIDWYTDFVEGNDRDDDGSLDSDERAERAEEEEKAKKAFKKFSKVVGGVSTIPASDFGEMMESMGTTYCEEEHRSTLKKLTKPGGVIKEADFLSWYIDWLFGDGSDDEDDEDDSEGEGDAGGASEEKTSLSSIFKVDKDSWRCDVCSVPNPSDKKKCAACETPRPGAEDDDEGDKSKPTSSLGSIGTGGFTFGSSAGGSIGSGGFSFGASSGAGASKTPESSSGGFTFGGSSASSTTAKPVASSGGFTFGGSSASSTTTKPVTSSGGFTFGGSSTSSTTEKPVTSSGGFSFGTSSGSTASSASPFGAFGSSSTSPFGAFGSPPTTSSGAHSMAKPLFSTKPAVPSSADKNEAKQPDPTPAKEAIPSKPVSATPSTAAGKRAATVFDQVDLSKKGVLPVSAFEDLLEEIGSGFHGEEYDAQIAILDPSESGNITRSAFIDWYTDFVEGNDRDDDGSLDSDERAERAEEEEKAKKAFKKFSKVVGGVSTIPASDFGEMMESMGTTYCEEEHRSTLKKLTKPGGVIKEADFLSWYIDWLFGDGSDDEDDEDDSEGEGDAGGASEEKTSLSSIFKVDKDSWRCDVCSVPNPSDKKKCAACETPRPGAEDDDEGDKSKPTSSLGSIGTGGFTFGSSAGGSIGSGGFSFGASSGAGASKTPESSSGGFTFGGSSASSTTAKPVASSGGFTFGGSSASSTTTKPVTSSGGFTFGGSSTSSTTEKPVTSSGGFTFGLPVGSVSKPVDSSAGVFSFGASSGSTTSSTTPFSAFSAASAAKPSGSNLGGAYPPLSSKAPTPFGGASTSNEPTKQSKLDKAPTASSYPPLASKAPTPFGASSTESSSGGAYPPMASKAPTPFGALTSSGSSSKSSSDAKSGSSSSYPPMSSTAPKPFGGTVAKTSSGGNSGSYPPLASKAPTPFGASSSSNPSMVKPQETQKSTASSSYPPIATKAPTPFGAITANPAGGNSGSLFPPLASKAPTPFGGASTSNEPTKQSKSDKAPTASSYPPLASKAPTPFGASSTESSSSGAYPPMASKAPTPFGALTSSGSSSKSSSDAKSGSSSSYPPMSSTAPKPFGGTVAKTSSGGNSGSYPPLASKAPTPFGASSSSNPSMVKPQETQKSTASSSYPPIATKAPTPFGGASTSNEATKQSKTDNAFTSASFPPLASKAPTPFGASSTKSSSGGAYPPMASKAPTPFSSNATSSGSNNSSSSSSLFPPLSTTAPTSFGSFPSNSFAFGAAASSVKPVKPPDSGTLPPISSQPPTPIGGLAPANPSEKTNGEQKSTSSTTKLNNIREVPRGIRLKIDKAKMTKPELKFASLTEQMENSLNKLYRNQVLESDSPGFERKIEKFITDVQAARMKVIDIDSGLIIQKKENAFLLSRKTDSSRQINEARRLVDSNRTANVNGNSSLVEMQPLDYESEQRRRKFAATAMSVRTQLELLDERIELLKKARHGKGEAVLQGLLDLYKRAKTFDQTIARVEGKVESAMQLVPITPTRRPASGRSTYGLNSPTSTATTKRPKPRALVSSSGGTANIQKDKRELVVPTVQKWRGIESTLEKIGRENAITVRIEGLSGGKTFSTASSQKQTVHSVSRNLGASLLLSPSKGPRLGSSANPTTNAVLFSSSSQAKPRSDWDRPSSIDQSRAQKIALSLPRDLKEVSIAEASRPTLSVLGTTPEKIQASLDVKRNNSEMRSSARPSKTPVSVSVQNVTSTNKLPEPKKSSAGFPPMPTKAPTPLSQLMGKPPKPSASSKAGPSYPPLSVDAPKPFSALKPKEQQESSKGPNLSIGKQVEKLTEGSKTSSGFDSGFGGMKGLGDSLFSSTNSTIKSETRELGAKTPDPMASQSDKDNDYETILTSFYQKHNPTKIGEAKKNLEKYKGREVEMFQKLAAKYNVPSPLDELNSGKASEAKTTAMSGMSAMTSSTLPAVASPFSTGSKPLTAPSPFGSAVGAAPIASSPFGKPPVPGQLSSPSPFGNPTSTSTPFGSTGMSTSNPSPFASSSLSMSSPSPFGPPSPAPAPQQMSSSNQTFNGRSARDLLLSFYQQKNPSKIAEVDKLLAKYHGSEELMFRNLARKYQLDPSVFGLPPAPAGGGFGSPQAGPAPSFGQQSALGGAQTPFGQSSGFGQTSSPGFGGGSSGHTFGSVGGSALGSSFGSLAQSSNPSPFGSSAPSFGAPASGFGSPAGAFGSATPFGAPRR